MPIAGADTGSGPEGIAFGKSGNLYVALAGTSKISLLRENGTEQTKFSGPAQNPGNPSKHRVQQQDQEPSGHEPRSLTGLPDPSFLLAVFDVYVNDKAAKLFKSDDDD